MADATMKKTMTKTILRNTLAYDDPEPTFTALVKARRKAGAPKASPHGDVCIICPKWLSRNGRPVPVHIPVMHPYSPIARAELAWMRATNHAVMLYDGVIALCPPLDDLKVLRDWEQQDWERRRSCGKPTDRTFPPLNVSQSRMTLSQQA
ncbi:hypothetical protein OH77DRAFT_269768 [Trametes cingulata]|nr:hypothetical protein OH77DRAFT_269768 [Trametes cingulata]